MIQMSSPTCRCFTTHKQRQDVTDFVRKAHLAYFGVKLGEQDKPWAPYSVCWSCVESLRKWINGKRNSLSFGIPVVWRESKNHLDDFYFFPVKVSQFNSKTKFMIYYPNLPSVPVSVFRTLESEGDESEVFQSKDSETSDECFESLHDPKVPK